MERGLEESSPGQECTCFNLCCPLCSPGREVGRQNRVLKLGQSQG